MFWHIVFEIALFKMCKLGHGFAAVTNNSQASVLKSAKISFMFMLHDHTALAGAQLHVVRLAV